VSLMRRFFCSDMSALLFLPHLVQAGLLTSRSDKLRCSHGQSPLYFETRPLRTPSVIQGQATDDDWQGMEGTGRGIF
jgi:hypothetical protein